MDELDKLEAALRAADAAGNVEDARRLAEAYAAAMASPPRAMSLADRYAAAGITPDDPTDGNSFLENALIGYGRAGMQTARGVGQLLGVVDNADVDEARRLDAPLMNTAGGKVGNFVGQAHQMMAMPGVAGGAGRLAPFINAGLQGGVFNALQETGTGESRKMNALVGTGAGIAGQAVSSGAGLLAKRAANAMNPVVKESIDLAKRAGIPLHLSQVTNSKALKATSSALNWLPFSGASRAAARQQGAFNAAVGRSFGAENAATLSDDVMQAAREKLSNEFTSIYSGKHIPIGDDVLERMMQVEQRAMEDLPDDAAKVVTKQLNKILTKADSGTLTGEQYQALRTSLGDAADGSATGRFVKMLRSELDKAAASGLGMKDAARLKKVQGQWANLRTTQDALKQVSGASGNVKPASLWPLVRKGSTPEMRKLAQIGQNVLKDSVPDSGTPAREMVYRTLGLAGGATAAGAATGYGLLGPLAKLGVAGATAGRMLNSPAAAGLLGQGAPSRAVAASLRPLPKIAPLAAPAITAPLELSISGGQPVSREEMERQLRAIGL